MLNDDVAFLNMFQLTSRGWTKTLIKEFLKEPDRWAAVSHWQNFTGKALYQIERVLLAESNTEFKLKYQKSIVLRKLSDIDCAKIDEIRSQQNILYKQWLASIRPEDVKRMLVIEKAAKIFNEAISKGYRTPHK